MFSGKSRDSVPAVLVALVTAAVVGLCGLLSSPETAYNHDTVRQ